MRTVDKGQCRPCKAMARCVQRITSTISKALVPRRRCVEKRGTHFDGRRGRVLKEGRLAGYKAYEPRFLSYVTARGTAALR